MERNTGAVMDAVLWEAIGQEKHDTLGTQLFLEGARAMHDRKTVTTTKAMEMLGVKGTDRVTLEKRKKTISADTTDGQLDA